MRSTNLSKLDNKVIFINTKTWKFKMKEGEFRINQIERHQSF